MEEADKLFSLNIKTKLMTMVRAYRSRTEGGLIFLPNLETEVLIGLVFLGTIWSVPDVGVGELTTSTEEIFSGEICS